MPDGSFQDLRKPLESSFHAEALLNATPIHLTQIGGKLRIFREPDHVIRHSFDISLVYEESRSLFEKEIGGASVTRGYHRQPARRPVQERFASAWYCCCVFIVPCSTVASIMSSSWPLSGADHPLSLFVAERYGHYRPTLDTSHVGNIRIRLCRRMTARTLQQVPVPESVPGHNFVLALLVPQCGWDRQADGA